MGIREHIIFPEINYDKIDKIKGLNITIVTTSKTDEEGRTLVEITGDALSELIKDQDWSYSASTDSHRPGKEGGRHIGKNVFND